MDAALLILKLLLPLAYLVTWALYARLFFSEEEGSKARQAQTVFLLTLGLHTALLLLLAVRFQRCPLGTQGEALLFMAWMLAIMHAVSERSAATRRMGFFILLPILFTAIPSLFLLGRDFSGIAERPSSWLIFHIVASLVSYASYSLAAILAWLYLLLHRRLKQKRFDLTFRKLPPLDKLDRLSAWWAALGTLTMILSCIIGFWWILHASVEGMKAREFAIYFVLAVFSFTEISRRAFGWRGKRHAQLVIAGFLILLLTNLLGAHGFR